MIDSFVTIGINIVFNFALIKFMAHRGLALATSISVIVTSVFLLFRLRKKIGAFGFSGSVKCGVKSLVAATAMGIVVYLLDSILAGNIGGGTVSELIALLISAGVGALIYFVIIYLFRIDEVDWVIKVVRDRLGKVGAKI